jgi:hypothetical protein
MPLLVPLAINGAASKNFFPSLGSSHPHSALGTALPANWRQESPRERMCASRNSAPPRGTVVALVLIASPPAVPPRGLPCYVPACRLLLPPRAPPLKRPPLKDTENVSTTSAEPSTGPTGASSQTPARVWDPHRFVEFALRAVLPVPHIPLRKCRHLLARGRA